MIKLKKIPVRFDQEAHTYTNEETGEMMKGITSTLLKRLFPDKYKDVPEAVLKKAAERGSFVHEEIELAESIGIEPTTKEARNYLILKDEHGLKLIANEWTVSDMEHYATNIDGIYEGGKDNEVWLADYKTTYKLDRDSLSWQLSICAFFLELNNPGLKVGKLLGIWLRDDIAEVVEVARREDKEVMALIMADQSDEPFVGSIQIFPDYFSDKELLLETLTRQIKSLTAQVDELKAELLEDMAAKGDKSFDTGRMLVTYVAPSKSSRFDSARFKKEHADLYGEYMKESETKASLKITIRD